MTAHLQYSIFETSTLDFLQKRFVKDSAIISRSKVAQGVAATVDWVLEQICDQLNVNTSANLEVTLLKTMIHLRRPQ